MARIEKRNIVFPRNGTVLSIDRPYILQSFKNLVPNTPATTQQARGTQTIRAESEKAKEALESLGILLLELCYGETI